MTTQAINAEWEEMLKQCPSLEAARTILGATYFQTAMSEPLQNLVHCCTQIALADWGCPEHAAYEFILKQRQQGISQ